MSTIVSLSESTACTLRVQVNLSGNMLGAAGAAALAPALAANGALIECDLRQNSMGEEEEASIRKKVQGKAGFVLHV